MVQYWRAAGLTYLKFCQVGSGVMRQGLKEPMKTKALKGGGYAIIKREWTAGVISKEMTMTPEGIVMAEEK
jgi:hypothetical protein